MDEALMSLAQITTKIVSSDKPNLVDFLIGLSSDFVFSESEELQSHATEVANSFNFNEIIQNDLENAIKKKGQIFDLIDYNDTKKHLLTMNQALIYSGFSNSIDSKEKKEDRIRTLQVNKKLHQN